MNNAFFFNFIHNILVLDVVTSQAWLTTLWLIGSCHGHNKLFTL